MIFALILIVGANIVFGGNNTAEDEQNSNADGSGNNNQEEVTITDDENNEKQSDSTTSNEKDSGGQGEGESGKNENAIDRLEVEESDESENDENNDDTENDQRDNESNKDEEGPNPDKVGEPIGTSQTGEHTSSYERGSVDWNEKIKAIKMATGLDDGMTLWRLENGGGPQKAVGKVSPEGVQDWMYVVNLQWVDQKGWKVTSVDRQSR
ncbi:YrrS family protein [Virgibacillus doumboii]|uniref:YrrS family protein n=1 Tax=Virgibacillus doumboii TaxID=2697503 RepID=UPI0013DEFA9F|nr:YrrS family protein [Virgibacillus doumboii]